MWLIGRLVSERPPEYLHDVPVSENHVVHIGDSGLPPRISRIVRGVRHSRDVAMGGETWERETVMVRSRIDASHRRDSEQDREHLRPAVAEDLYQPGQFVQVPDDTSGNAVFVKAADPDAVIVVESSHADAGQRLADVAEIGYPDGSTRFWPYAEIRPTV